MHGCFEQTEKDLKEGEKGKQGKEKDVAPNCTGCWVDAQKYCEWQGRDWALGARQNLASAVVCGKAKKG